MGISTKEFLSATEARRICDTSLCLKNRIYKLIKEAANENECELSWDMYRCSEKAVNDIIEDLKKSGYQVMYNRYNLTTLVIKW